MGRCYEFGVEIQPGCENTMVVSAEGGACECAHCGAHCPGRFAGCADVVAVPGRVPLSAPAWSRPGAEQRASPGVPAFEPSRSSNHPSKVIPHLGAVMSPGPPGGSNGHSSAAGIGTTELAAIHASLRELRAMIVSTEKPADDPAALVGPLVNAVETLTKKLLDRDERIGSAFVSFTARQAELGAQIDALTAAVATLEQAAGQPTSPSLRQFLSARRP